MDPCDSRHTERKEDTKLSVNPPTEFENTQLIMTFANAIVVLVQELIQQSIGQPKTAPRAKLTKYRSKSCDKTVAA